jgi:D-3-phosphoglycerate dehydrogenase
MHRLWFERALPDKFRPLLAGLAVPVGPAALTPDDPLQALHNAQAAIVGAKIIFDRAFFQRFPDLRAVIRTGIGYDNIHVPDATAAGVAAINVPDGTISTAEHAVALLLAAVKRLKHSDRDLRRGANPDSYQNFTGIELYDRRLGLVGLGRIGRRVAKVALALDMVVAAYDPFVTPEQAAALGVELAPTLEALLSASDVVSLHAPYVPETRHLINARTLALMKPGAFLINAARGGLVDEAALLAALESGHLAGAGLDVFDPEPPARDHPLLLRDDVLGTGHVAGATPAGKDRLLEGALRQALQVLRGERPPFLLNPEVWPGLERQFKPSEASHAD